MRVPEKPGWIHLFRQNPVFTFLNLKFPVHVEPPLSQGDFWIDAVKEAFFLCFYFGKCKTFAAFENVTPNMFLQFSKFLWNRLTVTHEENRLYNESINNYELWFNTNFLSFTVIKKISNIHISSYTNTATDFKTLKNCILWDCPLSNTISSCNEEYRCTLVW